MTYWYVQKNKKEHKEHLEKVFDVLRRHKLYTKRNKCKKIHIQIEYLGHVLSNIGVLVDPRKMETVVRWTIPKDMIDGFAKIVAPVTDFLKEIFENIIWTKDCHASFKVLKKTLAKIPVLRVMDLLKDRLVLWIDA